MDKKLISEITRIGEMMGIKNSSLIIESTLCPFCNVIMKRISDLSALATKNSDSIEFKYKVNELLEKVSKSNDLNSDQKASLQNVIKKLKEVESASDNVASFKSKVDAAIKQNDALSDVLPAKVNLIDNNIMRQMDYSKIYQDPKLVNDYFENNPLIKETITSIDVMFSDAPAFKTYLSKFKSVDEYLDGVGKTLKEQLIKDGLNETLSAGLANRFKIYMKGKIELNPNLNPFISKIDNVVEPISVNSVIKRDRKVGMGSETLEQRYADMYNDIIKKNGDELTNEEKLFKDSVEEWKNGKEVDFEKVLGTKVGDPVVNSGGGTVESVVANWEKRKPGYTIVRFSSVLIDLLAPIYNLLRTVGGLMPSSIYLKQVERGINELVTRFEKELSTAKIDPNNMSGFKNQVRRILIDMQVAKRSDQTFDQLWEEIEKMMRDKSKQLGVETEIDEFIKLVKQGGNGGGDGTIENFLKITSDYVNGITIWPWVNKTKLYKDFNFDRLGEYLPIMKKWGEFKTSWDKKIMKSSEGQKGLSAWLYSIKNIGSFLWEWFQGWLLYKAPKTIGSVNAMLRNGGITDGRAIKQIIGIYLGMIFIDYFYTPFIDATLQLTDWGKANLGISTNETRSYDKIIVDEYVKKFQDLLRGKIDWNPFGVGVIPAIIYSIFFDSPTKISQTQQAKLNDALNKELDKVIKTANTNAQKVYDDADTKTKYAIETNANYTDVKNILENNKFDNLTPDSQKFLLTRLKFSPTPKLTAFDGIKIPESDEDLKNFSLDTNISYQTIGNTILKGKSNKDYVVVQFKDKNSRFKDLTNTEDKNIETQGVAVVKPSYDEIKLKTELSFISLNQFVEQYNNL